MFFFVVFSLTCCHVAVVVVVVVVIVTLLLLLRFSLVLVIVLHVLVLVLVLVVLLLRLCGMLRQPTQCLDQDVYSPGRLRVCLPGSFNFIFFTKLLQTPKAKCVLTLITVIQLFAVAIQFVSP